jgi:UDP-2,3-diacylglucosamine hydrolase
VVPKGFTRFYSCLHQLKKAGVEIEIFTGNHDMWQFGFFESEFGIVVHHDLLFVDLNGTHFLLGHGDGKGPGDVGYKILKKIFNNKICIFLFGILHPNIGNKLAYFWSKKSRNSQIDSTKNDFTTPENEWLFNYCKKRSLTENVKHYVFGHRHLPLQLKINEQSTYTNLGDWISHNTYAMWDGTTLQLIKHC